MATSKIDDFADLLGGMPDEQVADLADVAVSTVKRWRAKLDIAPYEVSEQDDPLPPGLAEGPPTEDSLDAEREPEPVPAPPCVKVTAKRRVASWPFGWAPNVPHHLGRGDVYSGERAAWLWEHHRDICVPFPPA